MRGYFSSLLYSLIWINVALYTKELVFRDLSCSLNVENVSFTSHLVKAIDIPDRKTCSSDGTCESDLDFDEEEDLDEDEEYNSDEEEMDGVTYIKHSDKDSRRRTTHFEKGMEDDKEEDEVEGSETLSSVLESCPASIRNKVELSMTERAFFLNSNMDQVCYIEEQIPTIEVTNVQALGKLVALRFIEWVHANPEGVIALPTGRTPEMFIAYLKKYRSQWDSLDIQNDLKSNGIDTKVISRFPDTSNLKFVQLDEFFPIHPHHKNSFCHYINNLYFPLLDLKPENILSIDLLKDGTLTENELMETFDNGLVDANLWIKLQSIKEIKDKKKAKHASNQLMKTLKGKQKQQAQVLEKVDAFTTQYEAKVKQWGGIGFFLGGIGPDGHIAFNSPGSPLDSPTRLVFLNYPTAAAASGDLGGIEYARNKAAITIGLGTISNKADATIIIMAAGEGKAKQIIRAMETKERTIEVPASSLYGHHGARLYLSKGAAKGLSARKREMASTFLEEYLFLYQDDILSKLTGKFDSAKMGLSEDQVFNVKRWKGLSDEEKRANINIANDKFDEVSMEIITDLALAKGKRILDLTLEDVFNDFRAADLFETYEEIYSIINMDARMTSGRTHPDDLEAQQEVFDEMKKKIAARESDEEETEDSQALYEEEFRKRFADSLENIPRKKVPRKPKKGGNGVGPKRFDNEEDYDPDEDPTDEDADVEAEEDEDDEDDLDLDEDYEEEDLDDDDDDEDDEDDDEDEDDDLDEILDTDEFNERDDEESESHILEVLLENVVKRLIKKVESNVNGISGETMLHTAPHHDDIMLSYHAAMRELIDADNKHSYAYLTSGFHAVTNGYMIETIEHGLNYSTGNFFSKYENLINSKTTPYDDLMEEFVKAHWNPEYSNPKNPPDLEYEKDIESIIMFRNIARLYKLEDINAIVTKAEEEVKGLKSKLPGDKTPIEMQLLKGSMRESECDRLWALKGTRVSRDVHHLRSAFYTDDFFTPLPSIEKDAKPFMDLVKQVEPTIITVAFDPEGTGPDTHYKVLQVVATSVELLNEKNPSFSPKIWGYRNVWFRFGIPQTTLMLPTGDLEMDEMKDAFMTCFSTQRDASFPAPDYDGPFSDWSEVAQREQRKMLGVLLGENWFKTHKNQNIRDSTAFIFLKEMTVEEFTKSARSLKSAVTE